MVVDDDIQGWKVNYFQIDLKYFGKVKGHRYIVMYSGDVDMYLFFVNELRLKVHYN